MQKLKVHENKRYLMHEDGTPFFYLADTAWDLFQRLSRDEIEYYFSVRAAQDFTVIQCILLNGTEPLSWKNKIGRYAIKAPYDSFDYNEEWWENVDFALECAEKYGLYLGLLPMWNDKYNDPDNTLFTGYDASYEYGKYIGDRFKDKENIIWILGGDVYVKPHMDVIFDGLAAGIKAGEREDNHHLMTFHPRGNSDAITEIGGDKDYLDFLASQSGHTMDYSYEPYQYFPPMSAVNKPYFDAEAHYEDHVANWVAEYRTWDGADIRHGAYESLFAGACGQTYGNPIMAFFLSEPVALAKCPYYIGNFAKDSHEQGGWQRAMYHEGAESLKYLKRLFTSRPFFDLRPAQEMVLNSDDDFLFGRISAIRGNDYAFIYSPLGREIKVDCTHIDTEFIRASWFNPRTGEEKELCYLSPRVAVFTPETFGKGQDWVLILDGGKRDWKEISHLVSE